MLKEENRNTTKSKTKILREPFTKKQKLLKINFKTKKNLKKK